MKISVASEKTNPHMKRRELALTIEHSAESTPSKAAVEELLARQLSVDKDKIEIIDIVSETGLPNSRSLVLIWDEPRPKKAEAAPVAVEGAAPAESE